MTSENLDVSMLAGGSKNIPPNADLPFPVHGRFGDPRP